MYDRTLDLVSFIWVWIEKGVVSGFRARPKGPIKPIVRVSYHPNKFLSYVQTEAMNVIESSHFCTFFLKREHSAVLHIKHKINH